MAPRFSSSHFTNTDKTNYKSAVKPLGDANRDLRSCAILSAIPEIAKTSDKNNVSHAVFVRDGHGHNVDEDPEKEDNGMELVRCFYDILMLMNCNDWLV